MKALRFYLLDISGETTPQGSVIWLWGIDDAGKRVLIVDKVFKPYFYAIPKEDTRPDSILSSWQTDHADILDVSIEEKKLIGQTVRAVKITCTSTETLEAAASYLSKRGLVQQ
ncbi:hypothetical protein FDZ71_10325, partial [bacterium]